MRFAKIISVFLFLSLLFCKCSSKEYIYYYEELGGLTEPKKEQGYNPNNFDFSFNLVHDSDIIDKNKTIPLFVIVKFSGEYQYHPKNLKFEVFYNSFKLKLTDTIHYNISTVIDNQISNFKKKDTVINIPDLISRVKKENNISDSVKYFKVTALYSRINVGNSTNPEEIKLTVKATWDSGNKIKETIFILKKGEKQHYSVRFRPYG